MTEAPERRSFWRRPLLLLAGCISGLSLVLLAVVFLCAATLNSQSGREWLTARMVAAVNRFTDYEVSLANVRLPAMGHWQAQRIEVAHNGRTLLSVGQFEVRWRPYYLNEKRLLVDRLTAGSVELHHAGTTQEAPAARVVLPEDWPVPWFESIELKQLRISELHIREPVKNQPDSSPGVAAAAAGSTNPAVPVIPTISMDGGAQWRRPGGLAASLQMAIPREATRIELQVDSPYPREIKLRGLLQDNAGGYLSQRAGELLRLTEAPPLDTRFTTHLYLHETLQAEVQEIAFTLLEYDTRITGELDYAAETGSLKLEDLRLHMQERTHRLSGSLVEQDLDLELTLDQLPVQILGYWLPDVRGGTLSADLSVLGKLNEPRVNGYLQGTTRYRDLPVTVQMRASSDLQRLEIRELQAGVGTAQLKGSGNLYYKGAQVDAQVGVTDLISTELSALGVSLPDDLQFLVSAAEGRLSGSINNPDANLHLQAQGSYRDQAFVLKGQLSRNSSQLSSTGLNLQFDEGELHADGSYELQSQQLHLNLKAADLPLDLLALAGVSLPEDLSARVDAGLEVRGTTTDPGVLGDLALTGSYRNTPFRADLTGNYANADLQVLELGVKLNDQPVLTGDLQINSTELAVNLSANEFDTRLLEFFKSPLPPGLVQGELHLSGDPQLPQVQGNFVYNTRLGSHDEDGNPVKLPLRWTLQANREESDLTMLSKVQLGSNPEDRFQVSVGEQNLAAWWPLHSSRASTPDKLQVAADGSIDLRTISLLLLDSNQTLSGSLSAQMQVAGDMSVPRFHGNLAVDDASYTNFATGTLIERLNCGLSADQRMLQVTECSAADGAKGRLNISGGVELASKGNPGNIDLVLQARRAALLRKREVEGEISGDINVRGDFNRVLAQGSMEVSPFIAVLNSSLTHQIPSIQVEDIDQHAIDPQAIDPQAIDPQAIDPQDSDGEIGEPIAEPGPLIPEIALDIRLFADRQAYLRGRGLDAELQGEILITGSLANPVYDGKLNTVRGSIKLFGKKFNLVEGLVNFNNNAMLLSVEGVYEKSDRRIEALLSGTIDELDLQLSSTPAMPEDEILSFIIFGKSIQEMSPVEAIQLASAINTLRGSGGFDPLDTTRQLLGADTLYVESAEEGADGESSGGLSVGVGKYVNDKVYLEFQRTPNPSQPWRGHIEIELTPSLNLESSTGGKSGIEGAQLKWKRNYK